MKIDIEKICLKFGKNIREIREFLGMSQGDLAEITGLTRAAISMIESGHREPQLKTVVLIINALNVSFERLLK